MQFQTGNKLGRGRPKGAVGGRAQALQTLDRVLGKRSNREKLAGAIEKAFREDPMGFFKTVIMPLLPKDALVTLQRGGTIKWQSLLGVAAANVGATPAPVVDAGPTKPANGGGAA